MENGNKYGIQTPESCYTILKTLWANGFPSYLVGGCVRDALMGNTPHDYDIATQATPEEVINLFDKTIPTGIEYGTVTVLIGDDSYEITTFRSEQDYNYGRKPTIVNFSDTIEKDLSRRDFTINAIAYDPIHDIVVDSYGGFNDIQTQTLRTVGQADERFLEDPLRILRGYRFAIKYHLNIEDRTKNSMLHFLPLIKNLSNERINSELNKILSLNLNLENVETLWHMFCEVFPILKETKNFNQKNPHHKLTLDKHIMETIANANIAIERLPEEFKRNVNPSEVRLALLLHDIGKLYTQSFDENNIAHYYGHAEQGAQLAEIMLINRKFPIKTVQNVTYLIKHHQMTFPKNRKGTIKVLNKRGMINVSNILAMQYADKISHVSHDCGEINAVINKVLEVSKEPVVEFTLKDLAINGNDVMRVTGFTGKKIGDALQMCFEAILNDTIENERDELLKFLKTIHF